MGIKPSTSFEDAKRIYRKKMLELHPDVGSMKLQMLRDNLQNEFDQ